MGAGAWREAYTESLRGARLVILPDNDEPGRRHAHRIARSLHGIAREVRLVELPELPAKGDVSDWLQAEGTAETLKQLVHQSPLFEPSDEPPATRTDHEKPLDLADFHQPHPRCCLRPAPPDPPPHLYPSAPRP